MSNVIRIDASWLPPGYSTTEKDGLYASFHEGGQLAHVGWYREGEPCPGAWLLYVEKDGRSARVERAFHMERSADVAEPQVMSADPHPYRAAVAAPPEYVQWVTGIIEEIASYADGDRLRCSFCQRSARGADALITGPGVNICSSCVRLCVDVLAEQQGPKKRWWQVF